MADKLMYIPNNDTRTYKFCRLKLMVETFEHLTMQKKQLKFFEVPNVVKPMNKKTIL